MVVSWSPSSPRGHAICSLLANAWRRQRHAKKESSHLVLYISSVNHALNIFSWSQVKLCCSPLQSHGIWSTARQDAIVWWKLRGRRWPVNRGGRRQKRSYDCDSEVEIECILKHGDEDSDSEWLMGSNTPIWVGSYMEWGWTPPLSGIL